LDIILYIKLTQVQRCTCSLTNFFSLSAAELFSILLARRRESNPTLNSLYVQLLPNTVYIARFASLFLQNRSINMSNVSQKRQS